MGSWAAEGITPREVISEDAMDHLPLGQHLSVRNCSSACTKDELHLLGSIRKEPMPRQEQVCSAADGDRAKFLAVCRGLSLLLALQQFSPGVLPVYDMIHCAHSAFHVQQEQEWSLGCAGSVPL